MTQRWRAVGAVLAALVLVAAAFACLRPSGERDEARLEAARLRAQAAAEAWLRAEVRRVIALGESASQTWLEGSDAPDDAPFPRLLTLLGGPSVVPGARVAVYEEAADRSTPGLALVGYALADGVHRTKDPAWRGRVPDAILLAETASGPDAPEADDLVWFSLEDGTVRLHALASYQHTYEAEGRRRGSIDVLRAFEASVPVRAPADLAIEAACEVVEGRIEASLPLRAVGGGRLRSPQDVVAAAGVPDPHAWRQPSPDPRPRVVAAAPAPLPSTTPLRAYLAPWLGAGAALVLVVGLRRGRLATDVAAEAAHELKTPLTAMRGGLEVALRKDRSADEYRAALASTLEEVKGLQNVVGSLLLLTRGTETPPAREPVDLVAVVRAEAERLHGLARDREVTFASVRGPRIVLGDPSLLARGVANLLDNAHLHSVAGGAIRVRVEALRRELIVSVEDDGPGIPAPRRERIFQRFWRGPEVGQRGIPGAGLGLPIARFIARLHGGSLVLDPRVEGRARFVLRLPLEG